jgi:hypothetical protein
MTIQDEINARTIKTVKQAQNFAIETITAVADRVTPLLPKVESLPFGENLPKPSEVVEKAFDLSAVLLAGAKNIAVEAAKAFYPQAAKPAAKAPTAKPAAKPAATAAASTN